MGDHFFLLIFVELFCGVPAEEIRAHRRSGGHVARCTEMGTLMLRFEGEKKPPQRRALRAGFGGDKFISGGSRCVESTPTMFLRRHSTPNIFF